MNNIEHEQQDSSESSNMNAQSMLSVKCNSVTLLGKYVDSRVSTATMNSCVFSKKVCPPWVQVCPSGAPPAAAPWRRHCFWISAVIQGSFSFDFILSSAH